MSLIRSTVLAVLFVVAAGFSEIIYAQATAEKGSNAIGVMLGEPTGLSFKMWNSSSKAYAFGLAWSFSETDAISLHGDYLWHSWLDIDNGSLAFHYGIGARALFVEDNSGIGARVPLGLSYMFEDAPLDFFVEIVPGLRVIPDTEVDVMGGIGVRFYF